MICIIYERSNVAGIFTSECRYQWEENKNMYAHINL